MRSHLGHVVIDFTVSSLQYRTRDWCWGNWCLG